MENTAFLDGLAPVLLTTPDQLSAGYALTTENWDSLAILDTISLIDEHFGLTVPANELKACTSVGMLLDTIARAQAEQA